MERTPSYNPEKAAVQQLAQEISIQRKRFRDDDISSIKTAIRDSYTTKGKKFSESYFFKAARQCGLKGF